MSSPRRVTSRWWLWPGRDRCSQGTGRIFLFAASSSRKGLLSGKANFLPITPPFGTLLKNGSGAAVNGQGVFSRQLTIIPCAAAGGETTVSVPALFSGVRVEEPKPCVSSCPSIAGVSVACIAFSAPANGQNSDTRTAPNAPRHDHVTVPPLRLSDEQRAQIRPAGSVPRLSEVDSLARDTLCLAL
jgi:hypothetical protein